MENLSNRCQTNLTEIIAKIPKHLLQGPSNPNTIDLSFAENHLIRKEVFELVTTEIQNKLTAKLLDWPKGLWGDPELLELLSQLFNSYYHPRNVLEPQHFVVGPGASACLDALAYNICDEGQGILVPCPYWNGYDNFLRGHSGVTLIPVNVSNIEQALRLDIVQALEETLASTKTPIKALIISNPHNPLGRCYSRETLLGIAKFCSKNKVHLISDEVFALSVFRSNDLPDAPNFTSVLTIEAEAIHPDFIHVVWSVSKDLALSGSRLATIATRNQMLRNATALLGPVNVSTMVTLSCKAVLKADNVRRLVELNTVRLSQAYHMLTQRFKDSGVAYFPANCTTFLLAHLAPRAKSKEEEIAAFLQYSNAGVLLAAGSAYHLPTNNHGWFRVCFAVDPDVLKQALSTIINVYQELS